MTRIRFALMAVLVGVAVATASAGGWAVVTLDGLPERIEAGRQIPLTFMVRQHGVHPLGGLTPTVEATAGDLKVSAAAKPGTRVGHYAAALTFPRAGDWSITIHSGFVSSRLTLLPMRVSEPGSPPARAASIVETGRQLFVAKGCVTCHAQDVATSVPSLNIGPAIVPQKYRDEFLARVLENPSAALPPSREPVGKMPNLTLHRQEIAALVAYINHGPIVGTR